MLALSGAVLMASFLGSTHCAGMCGAFSALAVAMPGDRAASPLRLQTAYHLGRLVNYVLFGFVAGLIGSLVDLSGRAAGVSRLAVIAAGAATAIFGIVTVLRLMGFRVPTFPMPARWLSFIRRGHHAAFERGPVLRAAMLGIVTTWIPCGWLYAFVITASGTADPARGAVLMAIFWLGTVPMLAAVGAGARSAFGFLGRRLPLATAFILIGVGVATAAGRLSNTPLVPDARASESSVVPICHALQLDQSAPIIARRTP